MSARTFLDTNIFVYDVDSGAPKNKQGIANRLVETSVAGRSSVVSYQVIHEFVNVATRKLTAPLSSAKVRDYLEHALFRFSIEPASEAVVNRALEWTEARRISWYDALIVSAAVEADCATLYSEDLHHGLEFGRLKIINPFRVG